MRLELIATKEELQREKLIANEQIVDLSNEIKSTIAKYDEIINKMELEYNDRISQNLKYTLKRTETTEISLMDEIKKQEEDIDSLKKNNKELEKKIEFIKKQKENIELDYRKRIDALEKRDLKSEISKIDSKYQKILIDSKEKLEAQISYKEEHIKDLNQVQASNMKKILHLEGENKKFLEINQRLQQKVELLENSQNDSEEKFSSIIKEYESKFIELESNYQFEKQTNAYFRNMNRVANLGGCSNTTSVIYFIYISIILLYNQRTVRLC